MSVGNTGLKIILLGSVLIAALAYLNISPAPVLGASKGIGVRLMDSAGRPFDLYANSYALVIGVSRYTAGWPNLESVGPETERIKAALSAHNFNVDLVLNPTSDLLKSSVTNFINEHGLNQENRLVVFFSGHGHSRHNGTKGYLVPADAPDPRLDAKAFLRKAIPMSQVLEWSRRIESKHALFVFDSCFSGTIFKSKSLPDIPPHISDITSQPVRQFISAGSAGEEVPAKSVFVPSFIRALNGAGDLNQDSFVTGTELGMYLHQKILSYQTGQTPQYGKIRDPDLDEGDIVFSIVTNSALIPVKHNPTRPPATASVEKPVDEKPMVSDPAAKRPAAQNASASPVTEKEKEKEIGRKYIVHANGIVFDSHTGLEWVVGPDTDTSLKDARRWSRKLSLDGGGWRLPTRRELRSLFHKKSWFSYSLPEWVTVAGSGIRTSHFHDKMTGGIEYY